MLILLVRNEPQMVDTDGWLMSMKSEVSLTCSEEFTYHTVEFEQGVYVCVCRGVREAHMLLM